MLAGVGAAALSLAHVGSALITAARQGRPQLFRQRNTDPMPPITVIRPLKGLDPFAHATLQSTFRLSPSAAEILFCVERADDPVVPLVRQLMRENPETPARLLIGRDVISRNPKLNNLVKGWREAQQDWIAFIDSNVLLPHDALWQVWSRVDESTGMVCSPPVGAHAQGFAGRLECAFLNAHQARWQSTADILGNGFAQGKVMFFHRRVVDCAGGLKVLGAEPAEDAAATKVVRAQGLHVRLVDRFFEQPVGARTLAQVWDRQLRWAKLRRATFPLHFAAEVVTGALLPTLLTIVAANAAGLPALPIALTFFACWYLVEQGLASVLGWPSTVVYSITRDILMPAMWVKAWGSDAFEWHGHQMSADIRTPTVSAGSGPHTAHTPGATR
jgi:ceramide glucosyltransferase